MRRWIVELLTVASFLIIFLSCEEEAVTPAGPGDTQKAQELVNEGMEILAPNLVLIIGSEGQDTVALGRMALANTKFREAIQNDPNNVEAHFGAGLTEILLIGADSQLRQLFDTTGSFGKRSGKLSRNQLDVSKLSPYFPTTLRSMPISPRTPLQALYTVFSSAVQEPVPFSFYQDLIETRLLPKIQYASERFTFVSQHPNFVFRITQERFGPYVQEPIEIDLTEIFAVLAVLHSINADASILVAYNLDYDDTDSAAVVAAWQPSSPFLALRASGAQRMGDAGNSFRAVVLSIESAINFLISETDDQTDDVIRYDPASAPEIALLQAALDTLEMFLTTTMVVEEDFNDDGIPEQLTVNLSSVFSNPITNFKQKLPTYTPGAVPIAELHYGAVLTWQANSFAEWIFPDPTFNNVFPGMTDAAFKETFGIRAENWSKIWYLGP